MMYIWWPELFFVEALIFWLLLIDFDKLNCKICYQHKKTLLIFKRDFLSLFKSGWLFLTTQFKIMVLTFIPENLDSPIFPVLEQYHSECGPFWGVRGLPAQKFDQYLITDKNISEDYL